MIKKTTMILLSLLLLSQTVSPVFAVTQQSDKEVTVLEEQVENSLPEPVVPPAIVLPELEEQKAVEEESEIERTSDIANTEEEDPIIKDNKSEGTLDLSESKPNVGITKEESEIEQNGTREGSIIVSTEAEFRKYWADPNVDRIILSRDINISNRARTVRPYSSITVDGNGNSLYQSTNYDIPLTVGNRTTGAALATVVFEDIVHKTGQGWANYYGPMHIAHASVNEGTTFILRNCTMTSSQFLWGPSAQLIFQGIGRYTITTSYNGSPTNEFAECSNVIFDSGSDTDIRQEGKNQPVFRLYGTTDNSIILKEGARANIDTGYMLVVTTTSTKPHLGVHSGAKLFALVGPKVSDSFSTVDIAPKGTLFINEASTVSAALPGDFPLLNVDSLRVEGELNISSNLRERKYLLKSNITTMVLGNGSMIIRDYGNQDQTTGSLPGLVDITGSFGVTTNGSLVAESSRVGHSSIYYFNKANDTFSIQNPKNFFVSNKDKNLFNAPRGVKTRVSVPSTENIFASAFDSGNGTLDPRALKSSLITSRRVRGGDPNEKLSTVLEITGNGNSSGSSVVKVEEVNRNHYNDYTGYFDMYVVRTYSVGQGRIQLDNIPTGTNTISGTSNLLGQKIYISHDNDEYSVISNENNGKFSTSVAPKPATTLTNALGQMRAYYPYTLDTQTSKTFVQSIDVTPKKSKAIIEKSVKLSAEVQPSTANQQVSWTISKKGSGAPITDATVNSEGVVTSKVPGDFIVKATAKDGSGVSSEEQVSFYNAPNKVIINGPTITKVVESIKLQAQVFGLDGTTTNVDQSVTWSSSNTDIATVDDKGVVTGVSKGPVRITATSILGGVIATHDVIVEPNYVTSFNIDPIANIEGGSSERRQVTVRNILPATAPNKNMKYESSDPKVARVDSSGTITTFTVLKDTPVTIKVTAEDRILANAPPFVSKEVSFTVKAKSPDYLVVAPKFVLFDNKTLEAKGTVSLTNLDGTPYSGNQQVQIKVTSKNSFHLVNEAKEAIHYSNKSKDGFIDLGIFNQNNPNEAYKSKLEKGSKTKDVYTDTLTYEIIPQKK